MGWRVTPAGNWFGWQTWQRGQDQFRIEQYASMVESGPVRLLGYLCKYGGRDVAVDVLERNEVYSKDGTRITGRRLPPAPATRPPRQRARLSDLPPWTTARSRA
jgi:hypothetical protein